MRYQQKPSRHLAKPPPACFTNSCRLSGRKKKSQDWRDGKIVKIPKKEDLKDSKNYRGIMLLTTPGKVLNFILLKRLQKVVDETERDLRENQAAFLER